MNVLDTLRERGFIEQATHEKELYELFEKEKVTFYIGFDPTADSLHVGHFITIMAMMHLQQAGHRPIALCGGGTGMIGDPSGKADMRRVMTIEEIDHNVNRFKGQLSRFIDFGEGKAILANNADWLRNLNYVEFLREVGWHFTVNRMLAADAFKVRMDRDMGLSFTEFNYMIMQAYDFYELHKRYDCKVQLGGSDQWSNIIQGVELIRRKDQQPAFGMTLKLLTNSEGEKMGKTVAGALWLDKEKCSPYDFYQYWRNIHDKDVEKCLSLLTFLPMEEVRALSALKDKEINRAKEVLAYEVTKIIHGEEEAVKAQEAAKSVFGGQGGSALMPSVEVSGDQFYGKDILSLLVDIGIVPTKSEGRRVVQQGGLKINGEKIGSVDYIIAEKDYTSEGCVIQKGKKVFLKVTVI